MKPMPIIDEIHQIRQEHAARFNHDLYAIVGDLKRLEQEWPAPTVNLLPKLPHRQKLWSVEDSGVSLV
jgi:hypothetical protein